MADTAGLACRLDRHGAFVLAIALGVSAVITMIRAGSNVPTHPTDHDHRRTWTLSLYAQPDLPRHFPGTYRLGHRIQQTLVANDVGAVRARDPIQCRSPRGSLSHAQARRCLPRLLLARTTLDITRRWLRSGQPACRSTVRLAKHLTQQAPDLSSAEPVSPSPLQSKTSNPHRPTTQPRGFPAGGGFRTPHGIRKPSPSSPFDRVAPLL